MQSFSVTNCFTACIVIYLFFSMLLRYNRRRRLYEQAAKFPGPPTLPFVGNAHLFIGSNEAILKTCHELNKSYPSPVRLWIGSYLMFLVDTPEQFKVVLNSPETIDKGDLFDFGQPFLGTGILTASGSKWREHRRLIQPTFSIPILQEFVKIFAARSQKLAKDLEQHLDGPEFDIYRYAFQTALHTVCETAMGVNLTAESTKARSYEQALEEVMISICKRMISPWMHPDFIFQRTRFGKNQQELIKYLHTFTDNVIQSKKKELLKQSEHLGLADSTNDTSDEIPRRKVFLDHLMELAHGSQTLSDVELREEVDTIVSTGSDTTALASSYVMLMLASHPEIQEKVYQELLEIYKDNDEEEFHITPKDLTRMTYLERVIKETMRIFPNVPYIMRSVTNDLNIDEHTFPKGSIIVLQILELHRDQKYWPDPFKFDPDRFLPEEVQQRHSYTYLPFSGGPRNCIGSKYAMMAIKTLFATILQKYVLKKDNIIAAEDIRCKWELVMRPVEQFKIRIERRTQKVASV